MQTRRKSAVGGHEAAARAGTADWIDQIMRALQLAGNAKAVVYTEGLNDGQEILGVRICNPFLLRQ